MTYSATSQPILKHEVIPAVPGAELHKDHDVFIQSSRFSGFFGVEPAATHPNLDSSPDLLRMSSALQPGW